MGHTTHHHRWATFVKCGVGLGGYLPLLLPLILRMLPSMRPLPYTFFFAIKKNLLKLLLLLLEIFAAKFIY